MAESYKTYLGSVILTNRESKIKAWKKSLNLQTEIDYIEVYLR